MCVCACSHMGIRRIWYWMSSSVSLHFICEIGSLTISSRLSSQKPHLQSCLSPSTRARFKMGFLHFKWELQRRSLCHLNEAYPNSILSISWCSYPFEMNQSGLSWKNLTINSSATVILPVGTEIWNQFVLSHLLFPGTFANSGVV